MMREICMLRSRICGLEAMVVAGNREVLGCGHFEVRFIVFCGSCREARRDALTCGGPNPYVADESCVTSTTFPTAVYCGQMLAVHCLVNPNEIMIHEQSERLCVLGTN